MKHLYLFAILFILSIRLSAQSNYQPGYYVIMTNDTVRGFINYRGGENNPKTFEFKQTLAEKTPQKYSLENASAFGITGIEYFQRVITRVSTASVDVTDLPVHIDTNRRLDTAFFNVITSGKDIVLYNYTDRIKTRFFTKDNRSGQLRELDYFVYMVDERSSASETKNTFRTQLAELATAYKPGDNKLMNKIALARYAQNDIKAIVELINGGANAQLKQDNLFGTRYFAGAAARFGKFTARGGSAFFPDGTSGKSTAPMIDAGVDLFINKNTQRVYFRAEIGFTADHYTIPSTLVDGYQTRASLDFKQSSFSLSPQIVYNFYDAKKLKLFVDGGALLNVSIYNNYYTLHNYGGVSTTKDYGFPDLKHFWMLFPFKAGAQIDKHIEMYAAYAFSLTVTDYESISGSISYFQAGVNYLF